MIPNKTSDRKPQNSQKQPQCSAVPISSFPAQCIQSTVWVVVTAAAAGDKGEGEQETASRSLARSSAANKISRNQRRTLFASFEAREGIALSTEFGLARSGAEDEPR